MRRPMCLSAMPAARAEGYGTLEQGDMAARYGAGARRVTSGPHLGLPHMRGACMGSKPLVAAA